MIKKRAKAIADEQGDQEPITKGSPETVKVWPTEEATRSPFVEISHGGVGGRYDTTRPYEVPEQEAVVMMDSGLFTRIDPLAQKHD